MLWRGTRKVHNHAGQLFRLAAHSLHHNQTPMGDYLRRMKSKIGPAAATTATARKIAIIFYAMVSNKVEYDVTLWAQRDVQREQRFKDKLKRQAQQLGYKLVPMEENRLLNLLTPKGLKLSSSKSLSIVRQVPFAVKQKTSILENKSDKSQGVWGGQRPPLER